MNLDVNQVNLIKNTWQNTEIENTRMLFSKNFYRHIFKMSNEVRHLFVNDIKLPPGVFIFMISTIIENVERLSDIEQDIIKLGQRHKGYRVKPYMYMIVTRSFIITIDEWYKNDAQRLEISRAWIAFFKKLNTLMIHDSKFKQSNLIDIHKTSDRDFQKYIARQMNSSKQFCKCC